MAYFNLEGTLVSIQDGLPLKKGSLKPDEIAAIASSTVQDRLSALNFERVKFGSSSFYGHTRLPGAESPPKTDSKGTQQCATLLLPHAPASDGLWANNLAAIGELDYFTFLPQIEQHLTFSSSPIFLLSPNVPIEKSTSAAQALEEYQKQICDAWRSISSRVEQINVLAYGAGGTSLVLALAVDESLRNRINKIAFIDGDELLAKSLSLTAKLNEGKDSKAWDPSPVVTVLSRRAIVFKPSESPVGSVIKEAKDSHCACPIISIGPVEEKAIIFEGGALGLVYFRKKTPASMPKIFVWAIALLLVSLFILLFILAK